MNQSPVPGRPARHDELEIPAVYVPGEQDISTTAVWENNSPWAPYRGLWARIAGLLAGPAVWHASLAMMDQTVVSGTNFLTTLMIGRLCGAEELGVYALGFTLLVLLSNVQAAVLTTPYTIRATRLDNRERCEYAGSILAHFVLLAGLVTSCLMLAGFGWSISGAEGRFGSVLWVLAGAMPLALLREFVRRFAFAHLRIFVVLALDVTVAVIQLAGIAALAYSSQLSAVTAYLVMGLASAAAAGGVMLLIKADFKVRWKRVLPELRQGWRLGRWIVASRVTVLGQSYSIHWLLAALVGAATTGTYAACMTVLLAANPFVIGIGNVLEPRAARAMAEGGSSELTRVVCKATLLLGGVMGTYCGLVMLAGGWIVEWLYRGPQFENQGTTVAVLALAALVNSWGTGAGHGLRVLERPDVSFRTGLLALGITLVVAILLIDSLGTLGGACALLAGDSVAVTVRWLAFFRLVSTPVSQPSNRV